MSARPSILCSLAVTLTALAMACNSATLPSYIPTTAPTASPAPPTTGTPSAVPTASPTQAPTAPASPGAALTKAEAVVLAHEQSGGVEYQIIQQVTNTGSGWVRPATEASTFTIFDQAGTALEFAVLGPRVGVEIALPSRVAAGDTTYLLCNYFSDDFPLAAYQRAESEVILESVAGPSSVTLVMDNADTRPGTWSGLDVIADITNSGTQPIAGAEVGALFFDAAGNVIGFTSGLVQDIGPGTTKHVEIEGTFYIDVDSLADTMFFAQPWDF